MSGVGQNLQFSELFGFQNSGWVIVDLWEVFILEDSFTSK